MVYEMLNLVKIQKVVSYVILEAYEGAARDRGCESGRAADRCVTGVGLHIQRR